MTVLAPRRAVFAFAGVALALFPAACSEGLSDDMSPNAIQPETTLSITAEASVDVTPDIAFITAGVREEAENAQAALGANAAAMQGVFGALETAGVQQSDMQTSNISLQPNYDYVEVQDGPGRVRGEQRLVGYIASNQLTVKVRDISALGGILDSLVAAGGNELSGVRFAVDDDSGVRDQARRDAMASALARANLYAASAGLEVKRIVTISEGSSYSPQPMPMMAMSRSREAAPTPIAAGEVGYNASVNVTFELE